MDKDVIISVKDLEVSFYTNMRHNRVIRGISFEIKKSRILCVVGESGCGKSVTANVIMGLLPELSRIEGGSVVYNKDGEEIHIEKLARKGKEMQALRGNEIAMIFQDPMTSLNPVFTIGYQINETLLQHKYSKNKKEATEKSIELLRDMGISLPEQRVNEYPHQFSGGMRQRAMIAMAMACEPKLLIADEPTTALDVTIQAQIFDLMLKLKEENGTAIMLITHDMGVVAELADDVAVMYMGNIVESGTAEEVLGNPKHPYTKALMDSIPVLGLGKEQNLTPIRGSTPDPFNRPKGCQFCPRCDFATAKCEEEMPSEVLVEGSHKCRCFLYQEQEGCK